MNQYYCDSCEYYTNEPDIAAHEENCKVKKWSKIDGYSCPECLNTGVDFVSIEHEKQCQWFYKINTKPDLINHPAHYNSGKAHCECGRKIECIDVARHMNFNLGNALKYIWRSEHKNGAQDIEKAIWYLKDYLRGLNENRD